MKSTDIYESSLHTGTVDSFKALILINTNTNTNTKNTNTNTKVRQIQKQKFEEICSKSEKSPTK
jgi:hypothetical protein